MRVRIYVDGRPDWGPNTPSAVTSHRIAGSLVQGAPGPVEQARRMAHVKRDREAAERRAARG